MFKPVDPQPNFPELEEQTLKFWQEQHIFQKSLDQTKDGDLFVIYDGPPTANAKPPFHTMAPMSFKDVIGRYQTMRGKHVPRQLGWDTHGLPVEVQVEKALGLTGKPEILSLVPGDEAASVKKFNDICRQSVWDFKQEWDKFVPRVGYWADGDKPYITYDTPYVEGVWGVFKRIWDKQLVFKDYKVLPFCPRCGTGLSAAEVAQGYADVKDVSVYVSFPLVDRPDTSVLAWTTTPWTLPGNVALAVGADITYVEVLEDGRKYILAKERLSILKGEHEILETYKGSDLVGLKYQPLFTGILDETSEKHHEIVVADFVTTTDGTGVVHTAVMYGEDDFVLGKKEGLPQVHTVGLDGHFLPNVPEFEGLYVKDALVPILKNLTERERLYKKETITHSYPHCWRCKTPLIYYAKDSWYIAMSRLREDLVKNNAQVEWYPEHIKDGRFGDFVREARDWAVSRERFWGTPLPIWVSTSGNYICVGSFEELRSLAKNPEAIGSDFDPHRPGVDDVILVKDGEEYVHEPYILDVWFDSGAMPYASGSYAKQQFPADYISEAVDQTRGWFYTLLAISTALGEGPAYKRVMCIGHLVDEHGKKMSKSVGNTVDPWEAFKICGADAIRWFLYTVNSPGEAKSFSTKELQTSFRKSILLVWNVFNYFVTYANIAEFSAPENRESLATADLTELDRWILSRQANVHAQLTAHLNDYDIMRAGRLLEEYINDVSTWYLRRSRKRDDQAFFHVMYDVLMNLATFIAPLTPFFTESMYQTLRHASQPESIHLVSWPESLAGADDELEASMQQLRFIVELGLAIRAGEKMKVRQPLATAYITAAHTFTGEQQEILKDELNVLSISQSTTLPEGHPSKEGNGCGVALDVHLTDDLVQAGLSRDLQRQLQQLRKQCGLQPGQMAVLHAGPYARSVIEPLIHAEMLAESFLIITGATWTTEGTEEVSFNGETLQLSIIPHVE